MGWGGNHGGKGAREVAAAFYAGRKLTRGNCKTDGETYWLFDKAIARRVPDDEIPALVADIISSKIEPRAPLEFSWAGYVIPTTEAHLQALGLRAWKGSCNYKHPRPPELNGKPVDDSKWYSLPQLADMPAYVEPPRRKQTRFVNLTQPLFA